MASASDMKQTLPPEAIVMQMAMGCWISRAISDISRLNIPDMLTDRAGSAWVRCHPVLLAHTASGLLANPELLPDGRHFLSVFGGRCLSFAFVGCRIKRPRPDVSPACLRLPLSENLADLISDALAAVITNEADLTGC